LKWLFWISAFGIFYAYLGYPLLLVVVSLFKHQDVEQADIFPDVSLIIAVHNEEKVIREKFENSLSQDYPEDKLEIIVASDCSDDKTDEIVSKFEEKGVKLISIPERRGKEYAQKQAIKKAKGEILVFTDASIMLSKDALRHMVKNFNDETVGCVSSVDKIINSESEGEGFYVKYEMFLRKLESKICSLIGLSGSLFAVRRELSSSWPNDLPSDFVIPLVGLKKGYRSIIDPRVIGFYRTLPFSISEFQRKVRTVLRGITAFMERSIEFLNPFSYGFFSLELFSHKLLRWLVPFLLITVLISSVYLYTFSPFYKVIFIFQIAFYFSAILGFINEKLGTHKLFKIPSFFCIVNYSILIAWVKFLSGKREIFWEPSRRQ